MANEGRVTTSLSMRKSPVNIPGRQQTYQFDVTSGKGPSPGKIDVTPIGVAIDLSALTWPSVWQIFNQSDDEDVVLIYGPKDISTGVFYPINELRYGEHHGPMRLYRYFSEEHSGTGTTAMGNCQLWVRSLFGDGVVSVEAYEE